MTKEIIPPGIDPASIRYYIQFSEEELYRISPINKESEPTGNRFGEKYVPKILVLDGLDINSLTSEVLSIVPKNPIYSFRVIIKFDISRTDSQPINEYYIPPSIDFYECHITDKESYLKV